MLMAIVGAVLAALAVAPYAADRSGDADDARRLPQGDRRVSLDPGDFSLDIDNPYWPMRPGSRWVFRETDPAGTDQKVVVTVTDQTKLIANGIRARVVRDEVTEDGVPVEVTEDRAAVVTIGEEQVDVPFGHFTGVLMTRDLVPTEPRVQELKFYARSIGPVLSLHTDGPGGRAALVSFTPAR
jgi:hypothetical protein